MSPAIKNTILGVVAVLAVGYAIYRFTQSGQPEIPASEQSITVWRCWETGDIFRWNAKQVNERMTDPEWARHDPKFPAKLLVFKNPNTGDFTVVSAKRCRATKEWICEVNPYTGETQYCPGVKQ